MAGRSSSEAKRVLIKSTLIYGPAILLTRISALLFLLMATRLIDPVEYGLLTLVVTVGEMTDTALTGWLRITLLRLGGKGEITRGSLMRAGAILMATTTASLFVSVGISAVVVPEHWADFSMAVCAYLVAGAVARYALTVLQMQQRHSTYSMLEFLRAVLQLAMPAATMIFDHNSFLAISLASSLGMLIAGLVANIVALRGLVEGPARFTHREFLSLGIPIICIALVGFGLSNTERLLLKVYQNAAAVAIFASAYALARQPVDMISNAINMGAFPEVVGRFDEQGPQAAAEVLTRFLALTLTLALPVVAMLSATGPDIAAFLLPADYVGPYGLLFSVIGISALCTNIADFVYGSMVYAHKRPWLFVISKTVGTCANVGLSMLLLSSSAETGAAFALLGASLTNLVACIAISERLTPIPVPWRSIGVSVLTSASIFGAAFALRHALAEAPVLARLTACGAGGAVVFLALGALFNPRATRDLLVQVRSKLAPRRRQS